MNLLDVINNDIAKSLIKKGADLEIKDEEGNTPLLLSIYRDRNDIAKLLIEKGVNLEVTNKYGHTPLSVSIVSDNYDIVKLLIKKGADINRIPLTMVTFNARFSDNDIVKLLIDNGINIESKNEDGDTALIYSVIYDQIDTVKLLLENGADVYARNNKGETVYDVVKGKINFYAGLHNNNRDLTELNEQALEIERIIRSYMNNILLNNTVSFNRYVNDKKIPSDLENLVKHYSLRFSKKSKRSKRIKKYN